MRCCSRPSDPLVLDMTDKLPVVLDVEDEAVPQAVGYIQDDKRSQLGRGFLGYQNLESLSDWSLTSGTASEQGPQTLARWVQTLKHLICLSVRECRASRSSGYASCTKPPMICDAQVPRDSKCPGKHRWTAANVMSLAAVVAQTPCNANRRGCRRRSRLLGEPLRDRVTGMPLGKGAGASSELHLCV